MALWKYSVALAWAGSGSPGVNVWHMRTTGGVPSSGEIQGLVDAVGQFYDDISAIFSTSTTITGPDQVIGNFESSPEFQAVDGFTVTGDSGTSSYLPLASQLVVGWRTSNATRSGRGRTFLGPLAANALDVNGTPSSAVLTAVRDAAADLVATSSGFADGAIGVWSPTDGVLRDFTGTVTRDTFAVLRSRRD